MTRGLSAFLCLLGFNAATFLWSSLDGTVPVWVWPFLLMGTFIAIGYILGAAKPEGELPGEDPLDTPRPGSQVGEAE